MLYCSIDCETTGLDFDVCQVLEIAAIIEDTNHPEYTLDEVPCFSYILEWPRYIGQAYAINMNARIFEKLASVAKDKMNESAKSEYGIVPMDKAGDYFYQWLKANEVLDDKSGSITVAGKNVIGFDKRMLESVPNFFHRFKFRHRAIDPGVLYWDPFTDSQLPSLEECKKRAGLDNTKVSHVALQDAWDVIQVMRKKYDYLSTNWETNKQ